jgi:DNA-binding transcriptional LysR family regulator
MLNLNDLHVFVHVVDHGGFTAAGRVLGVPKSTLSKRVAELEKTAGARLIQRTSRRFAVTELGREFYRHAAAMVIEAQAAENVIAGRLAEPSGTVRVTASVPTAQRMLARALPRIAVDYPKLRVELTATDRFVDLVQEGYDIAVRNHFSRLPDSELVQRPVAREAIWLVASPDYLARRGEPLAPDELESHEGLFVSSTERVWRLAHDDGTQTEVRPALRYCANEGVALIEAVRAGLGIACLPEGHVADDVAAGVLRRVLDGWNAGQVTTTLLVAHRRGLLPSVRVVVDRLVEVLTRSPVV